MENTSAIEKRENVTENISVKIVYPDNVPEIIQQQKLNRMYDIFSGAMCRNSAEKTAE